MSARISSAVFCVCFSLPVVAIADEKRPEELDVVEVHSTKPEETDISAASSGIIRENQLKNRPIGLPKSSKWCRA
jgi:hypothetical protein